MREGGTAKKKSAAVLMQEENRRRLRELMGIARAFIGSPIVTVAQVSFSNCLLLRMAARLGLVEIVRAFVERMQTSLLINDELKCMLLDFFLHFHFVFDSF
jgi:hypothetical protein